MRWFDGFFGVLVGIGISYGWWDIVVRRDYMHKAWMCDACRQAIAEIQQRCRLYVSTLNSKGQRPARSIEPIGPPHIHVCPFHAEQFKCADPRCRRPLTAFCNRESLSEVLHDCKQWPSARSEPDR